MIHYKDCYDNNGKIIYENSLPKLHQSPLEGGVLFYDDILVNSTAEDTYAKTVEKHCGLIRKAMGKISFHKKTYNGITKDEFIKIILKLAILPTEALQDNELDESEDETIPRIKRPRAIHFQDSYKRFL